MRNFTNTSTRWPWFLGYVYWMTWFTTTVPSAEWMIWGFSVIWPLPCLECYISPKTRKDHIQNSLSCTTFITIEKRCNICYRNVSILPPIKLSSTRAYTFDHFQIKVPICEMDLLHERKYKSACRSATVISPQNEVVRGTGSYQRDAVLFYIKYNTPGIVDKANYQWLPNACMYPLTSDIF